MRKISKPRKTNAIVLNILPCHTLSFLRAIRHKQVIPVAIRASTTKCHMLKIWGYSVKLLSLLSKRHPNIFSQILIKTSQKYAFVKCKNSIAYFFKEFNLLQSTNFTKYINWRARRLTKKLFYNKCRRK